ncbi:hypothetical protein [Pseudomonas sp. SWRI22]|uniref:hypothetical protein n=1 Tax=Pseudomonas sp. SWRI22 TaxID=2745513 RepID=UPI0020CEBE2A|nr:hypothetical protein [Pseudomonas sp. SWRI22]
MNPIFNNLTQEILENIEDQLANNEVSTNEELWDFFVEELEMTAEQADAAVALRHKYLGQIFSLGTALYFKTRRYRLTRTIKRSNRITFYFPSNNTYS